jgi:hypothetical protein
MQARHVQHAFRQDAQERVVRFRPAAIEFIVDDGLAEPAGGGDAVVDPQCAAFFLQFHNRGNVVVDDT